MSNLVPPARIKGIGTAWGAFPLSRDRAIELATPLCATDEREKRLLRAIYKGTKIVSRSVVLPEANGGAPFFAGDENPTTPQRMERFQQEAIKLSEWAVLQALEEAAWSPDSVTHLVTVTCTGFASPGHEIGLISRVGFPLDVERVHIGFMGCHGAINGLKTAAAIAKAHPGSRVLLCATEVCSVHFQYGWDSEQVTANALFSDGSAAVAIEATSDKPGYTIRSTASRHFPNTEGEMGWRIGSHGFEMNLSSAVPGLLAGVVGEWVDDWLSREKLHRSEVGAWAIHPGGPRILDAVADALKLDEGRMKPSWEIFERHGNMSSPTILFILKELMKSEARVPWIGLAFGPGLSAEGVLIDA